MKVQQVTIIDSNQDSVDFEFAPNLIMIFASKRFLKETSLIKKIRLEYSDAYIIGCSTAGEISGQQVLDDSCVVTAVLFEKTTMSSSSVAISDYSNSEDAGKALMGELSLTKLRHVIVLSDGLNVNGAELVKGVSGMLPTDVKVTGGLAADGADFNTTYVINNEGDIEEGIIVAIGFYGEQFKVAYGSMGGWDSFGIVRLVTKSSSNVLYELDGQPALELYKSFLGEKAKDLPSSGLLFPLSLKVNPEDKPIVRTILAVDEETQSMTFAGDIPEGAHVRLMKANTNRLIDGAGKSAEVCMDAFDMSDPKLALLISCVGRKLVLKQLVEEEVEAVEEVIGNNVVLAGFYSYGEIAPFGQFSPCELHNQTMTITVFSE